ncbi:maternal protein exuperantia-1 [Agrilus planipennis]|uniref:Maternal protein exuperantia-1 n=1 Tax=Agrilus planipennis TaxID=224129 RepID=A0A1W4WW29_AGRPL|nr:maternal protein exuperantia-1 [Agrilus planipennis]XP_018324339.1 maternal protein exuperantia-1 [Agrilus planipennis]XP_018324340.1 maternal protein exuperantia-1 [Agrilus planipennis]
MVQNESVSDIEEFSGSSKTPAKGIPEGKYQLVGLGIDTTGSRLIDEIVQIAGYTSAGQFSQYIMPFSDLNPAYKRRHLLRVVNLGRYRMLKDMKTNKFIKTKSEISALTDFIDWLETVRRDATDGIILVYHEFRKTTPAMLLEALHRYNLTDKFKSVVKGFVNSFYVAESKCNKTMKSFTLRMMAQVLLNREDEFTSATDRAKAIYEVVIHLGQAEKPDLHSQGSGDSSGAEKHLIDFIRPFTNPVDAEEDEIAGFKKLLQRQNTFKPVFGALLRATRSERVHASHLRRLLAENNIDYEKLKTAYQTSARQGIEKILKDEVPNAKEKDITELLEILDCFFDPDKKAVQPKPRFFSNQRRVPRSRKFSDREKTKNNNVSSANNSSETTSANLSNEATPRTEETTTVENNSAAEPPVPVAAAVQ